MGILGSIKKSRAIKNITSAYNSNLLSDNKNISEKIFSFLQNNLPFSDLLRNDETFRKINPKLISEIITEFELVGMGSMHSVSGHCPAISSFFFPDILFFLIVARSNNKIDIQLLHDIDDYFRNNKLVFSPTKDPRYERPWEDKKESSEPLKEKKIHDKKIEETPQNLKKIIDDILKD